jgi:hypothetical protein
VAAIQPAMAGPLLPGRVDATMILSVVMAIDLQSFDELTMFDCQLHERST